MSAPELLECPHVERCPGCALIGLPEAAQLAAKAERLARALARFDELAACAPVPVRAAAPRAGYRTRAKLVVAPGPRLGLFARGGAHEVLDLPGCRVLAPVIVEGAAALRRLLAAPPSAAEGALRAEGDGPGRLRAVELREVVGDGPPGLLATLVLRAPPAPGAVALEAAADALARELPALRALAVSLHDGRSPQLLGSAPRVVRGDALHRDRVRQGAPWSLAAPGGFAQAHRGQAAALHAAVEGALGPLEGRRVLELYAGSGALGLALAARGARATLVEAFAPAAHAAADAARAQGLALEVLTEPAERALPRLRAAGARFDAAVVNPPRRGVPPAVREALAALCDGPLVYLSCEPETLARDLAHLAWLGRRVERLTPFDLMPQTAEVECVAELARGPAPVPRVLFADAGLVAVAKPPHVACEGPLLAAVRALAGAAGAVAVGELATELSGACVFAASADAADRVRAALAAPDAAGRWLALVRGVARAGGRLGGRGRRVELRYRRLAVVAGHALLEVRARPGDGETLRQALARVGEPILGDERHGHAPSNRHLFERAGLDRPFLHLEVSSFEHPPGGAPLALADPLAPDLAAVLARLGVDAAVLARLAETAA
jgi:23S rRNA (uracil1939-C5)-methyltransferase